MFSFSFTESYDLFALIWAINVSGAPFIWSLPPPHKRVYQDEKQIHGQNHLNLFNNRQQPKKKRKSRTAFTNHQIFELEKRFLYQKYLSPADRDEIASSLGLTNAQVITWFQNRRAKLKRDMEELKKDVESAKLLSAHKSFLENVTDLGILKKKAVISEDDCPKNLVVSEK
nr:unnamed protein product [Callosobruchus analis]